MVLKFFKAGKKAIKMLKVKPLSERKKFGEKNEKIMKEIMDSRKENIKTQQSLNKLKMSKDMETKPLKTSVKNDIKIDQEASKKAGYKKGGMVQRSCQQIKGWGKARKR